MALLMLRTIGFSHALHNVLKRIWEKQIREQNSCFRGRVEDLIYFKLSNTLVVHKTLSTLAP